MNIFKNSCYIFLSLLIGSCGIYSYTGDIYATTVSVDNIKNHVKTLSPDINFQISEKLKRKLNQQPGLMVVEDNSNLKIEGAIKDLNISPFSIGANNVVYINRVTLKISIIAINNDSNEKTSEKDIVAFADYDAKQNFGKINDSIYNLLSSRIVEEIYNELFLKW